MTAADVRFYRAGDEDPTALTGRTVAVIGYGNLGRSVALNLRDSGVAVIIGNIDDEYRVPAAGDGFTVLDMGEGGQLVSQGVTRTQPFGADGYTADH